jgi:hypothetical protein
MATKKAGKKLRRSKKIKKVTNLKINMHGPTAVE